VTDDARIIVDRADARREVRLGDYLSLDDIEQADRDAIAWIKAARHADLDGRPLRERLTYRGDSLWWFVEIYLHRMRVIETLLRAVTAADHLFERERPRSVTLLNGDAMAQDVLRAAAARHGATYRGASSGWWYDARGLAATMARGLVFLVQSVVAHLRGPSRRAAGSTRRGAIAAFVHSAFWRSTADREAYVGPVLKELVARTEPGDLVFVGLGPRTVFRARTLATHVREWQDAPPPDVESVEGFGGLGVLRGSFACAWQAGRVRRWLWRSPSLRAASVFRGYNLWRFIRHELAGIAYLQLPWSARAIDETAAALDALEPRLALTYAEAGGWGRALVIAARRRGIPVCGIQHGFIHRHWMNYLHEPDEMAAAAGGTGTPGFPRPDLTLLFDRFALTHLTTGGAFPASTLDVMGNPRLDALAAAARLLTDDSRRQARTQLGAAPGARIVLLATKYRERARRSLAALFDAVRRMPDVHLAIRCHPAETPAPYLALAQGAPNIAVAPPAVDLVSALAVADLVVTVNSTVALEGMALGVTALALNLPNYLSPFVDAGVMHGASTPGTVEQALARALADDPAHQQFRAHQRTFMAEYEMLPSGMAADRAVRAILGLSRPAGS